MFKMVFGNLSLEQTPSKTSLEQTPKNSTWLCGYPIETSYLVTSGTKNPSGKYLNPS